MIEFFKSYNYEGKLYIGYPIYYNNGESIVIDSVWISKKFGVMIFDLQNYTLEYNKDYIINWQTKLLNTVEADLRKYDFFYKGRGRKREFNVQIDLITFAPNLSEDLIDIENRILNYRALKEIFNNEIYEWKVKDSEIYLKLLSVIQNIINLKSGKKRKYVKLDFSKGAIVKKLEDLISNLDLEQEKAIIETFNGIQRIRGLAGSGKTVVLALKTAYIHMLHPEWNIAVTFHTRSLKNQFEKLLDKFCLLKSGETFDRQKVKIIHAWGSPKQGEGIYYNFCLEHNLEFLDFNKARKMCKKGNNLYDVIVNYAFNQIKQNDITIKQQYDAILVDEAQDLSPMFLKLCFEILKEPKRLVYAYDELQKLDEGSSLPSPIEMFGRDLEKDTILKVCYRNTRPVLVTVHSLGFGIYRNEKYLKKGEPKLVQFFDEPKLWEEIGYEVELGELKPNMRVVLKRTENSSPKEIESLVNMNRSEIIKFNVFKDKKQQAEWIANEIEKNIKDEELLPSDILVINPLALTTKEEVGLIRGLLYEKGIKSHLAGALNPDIFYEEDSVIFSGVFRAKGNEVPMVYIINANDCYSGEGLKQLRNILFTSITRSKAWVRVCGIGEKMEELTKEFIETKHKDYKLDFIYPSPEEIEKMNIIHRDLTNEEKFEKRNVENSIKMLEEIAKQICEGKKYLEDYDETTQEMLQIFLKKYNCV